MLRAIRVRVRFRVRIKTVVCNRDYLLRDHTTDAACGASSKREPRCRSAVPVLACCTISFADHFWFCFVFFERTFFWISFQRVVEVLVHLLGVLRARSVCFCYIRLRWVPSLARPEMDLQYLFRQCGVACFRRIFFFFNTEGWRACFRES
jgi:hypothetical protein